VALRGLFRGAVAATALVGVAVLSGCGEAPQTETVTVTTTGPSTRATTTQPKVKPRTTSGNRPSASHRRGTILTACDPNVRAKAATTTCGFAENVFYEYWLSQTYGAGNEIKAFSSALGMFLAVECSARELVTCRTQAGGLVRFPVSAVSAYTLENAQTYARRHTVSGGPDAGKAPETSASGSGEDCDPNYEGACLDPAASDYDCDGGSGDGPEYTGTVTVVGDDHFGLDRDEDGVGCQP
jgi:hypothetical protein